MSDIQSFGHRGYCLHCLVLVLQTAVVIVTFVVGIMLLATLHNTEIVTNTKDPDSAPPLSPENLRRVLVAIGVVAVAVSAVVLANLLQVISLVLGPNSPVLRRLWWLNRLRERIQDELLMLRAKREVRWTAAAKIYSSNDRRKNVIVGNILKKAIGSLEKL